MNWKRKIDLRVILAFVMLAAVVTPLIILGFHNYPMGDDWCFGVYVHKAVQNKEGILGIFKAIWQAVATNYQKGEPRFAAVILGSVMPAAFGGEHLYFSVTIILIGALGLFQYLLLKAVLGDRKSAFLVLSPVLCLELLCVPFPTESFYWYDGSVVYTFVDALSLWLLVLFFKISNIEFAGTKKYVAPLMYLGVILLSIMVAGSNYGVTLSRLSLFAFVSLQYVFAARRKLFRTLPITLTMIAALIPCIVAPGVAMRLEQPEYAEAGYGAVEAILRSVGHTAYASFWWTIQPKMIACIILIIPVTAIALRRRMAEKQLLFRWPLFFTIISFLAYSAEIVPNYYVEGGIRACRMADIFWYDYHVFIIANVVYWVGWTVQTLDKHGKSVKIGVFVRQHLFAWYLVLSACMMFLFAAKELKTSSTYRAAAWLYKGYAREYSEEWEKRLDLLHDPDQDEVVFDNIDLPRELVFYADYDDAPDRWINRMCEEYYGKTQIEIRK